MLSTLRHCTFCKKWAPPTLGQSRYVELSDPFKSIEGVPLCSGCGMDLIWIPLARSKAQPAFIEGTLRAGESSPELDIPPGFIAYAFRVRIPRTGRVVLMDKLEAGWTYGLAHTHHADKIWERQHGRAETVRLDCVTAAEPIDYYLSYVRPDPSTKAEDSPGVRGLREEGVL